MQSTCLAPPCRIIGHILGGPVGNRAAPCLDFLSALENEAAAQKDKTVMSSLQCKLILLGNGSVGKTSIIGRFTDDGFQRVYKQTIGLDFFEKRVTVKGNQQITLQVWDIGGQSIASKMLPKYIHGTQVVFLCYDVTDRASFDDGLM